MRIKLPNSQTKRLTQTNNSNVLGSLWSSFCLELTENIGRIRAAFRTLMTTSSETTADLELPVVFLTYKTINTDNIWMLADGFVWKNGGNTDDVFVKDATASSPTVTAESDAELYNGGFYVKASNGDVVKYDGSWSTVTTVTSGDECVWCQFAGRLYGTQSTSQIFSIDLDDTVVEPSAFPNGVAYTLNLADFGVGGSSANKITSMGATADRIFIGTMDQSDQDRSAGRRTKIFEWDGAATQANRVHNIDSVGIMAIVIKNDTAYAIDADGRVLKYNGLDFVEIARFPLKPSQYLYNPLGSAEERFLHHRGVAVRNNRILILIKNEIQEDESINENLPSGVWELDESTDPATLSHKYGISMSTSGSVIDYAQNRLYRVGALFSAKQTDDGDTNGDLLIGAGYYTNGAGDTEFGTFVNDTHNTTKKTAYFITQQIESDGIAETWQKAVVKYKRFLDAADKIILSYRWDDPEPLELEITWTSTTTFTTSQDITAYEEWDEVEGIQGRGAGQCVHITDIALDEDTGVSTVTLQDAVVGATGTSIVRFQKWRKMDVDGANVQGTFFKEMAIGGDAHTIMQVKCVMFFTGDDEIQELQIISDTHLPG